MRNLVIKWSNEASGIHGSEDGNIMYKPGYFWQLWSLHQGTPLSPKYSPSSSTARIVFCRAVSAICMAIQPEAGDILYSLYPLKIVTSSNQYWPVFFQCWALECEESLWQVSSTDHKSLIIVFYTVFMLTSALQLWCSVAVFLGWFALKSQALWYNNTILAQRHH